MFQENPYIIAEISGNHNGNIDQALALIKEVSLTGANAVKLQTFTAEEMVSDKSNIDHQASENSIWKGSSLVDLYKKASTPREWHERLFQYGRSLGLDVFSSPFSISAVEFLETLNCPFYKIASFEITDLQLIEKAASTKKPLIISCGMTNISEIHTAVETARKAGADEICLMKCTSTYPSNPSDSNIRTIPSLRDVFGCSVGLSDHTLGIGVAVASVALGAVAIEKHIKLEGDSNSIDSSFALTPSEFKAMVMASRQAYSALGKVEFNPSSSEIDSRKKRRSLFIKNDKNEGDTLNYEDISCLRPGTGISPADIEKIIGLQLKQSIKAGSALHWNLFK